MVRITKISYGKTFNLGNYEAERISLEAELGVNETTETMVNYAYTTLKQKVHELHTDGLNNGAM